MNLYCELVRTSKLSEDDIESKPGFEIIRNSETKKAVHVSHHQSNAKYGESAGMQCNSNAYFAINFSSIKNIDI